MTQSRLRGSAVFLAFLVVARASLAIGGDAAASAEAQFAIAEGFRCRDRDYLGAIRAYRKVAALWPEAEWAARALDMVAFIRYYNLKECEKAVAVYEELIAKHPNTPEADYGLFVAGNLLFRVLQRPERAAQKHCQYLARCRELQLTSDPTIARATNQLWRAAQRLCLDDGNPVSPKGQADVKGNLRAKQFGVYFAPKAAYTLSYGLTLEAKTFRVESKQDVGRGFVTAFVDDLYTPYRVVVDGEPYPCHTLIDKHMVVAGLEAGRTYAVKGLDHRGRLTVKGSFECEPFKLWFSDGPDVVVDVDYDIATRRKRFTFEFEEMITDKRGKIIMPLREGETSVRVLQEGRPFDKFRIEGLEKEPPSTTKTRRRPVEPPKPKKITLIVEEVDPTKTYVIEPAGAVPDDALHEAPAEEAEDAGFP